MNLDTGGLVIVITWELANVVRVNPNQCVYIGVQCVYLKVCVCLV